MATVNVPQGFAAVVVLIALDENVDKVSIKLENVPDGEEHEYVADAIMALAGAQTDIIDGLLAEDDPDADGEDDDEVEDDPENPK
jgi:hypothetical protein